MMEGEGKEGIRVIAVIQCIQYIHRLPQPEIILDS